nr:RNA-directed DNA polymerase, eukaryota [Tanacetum cinerariifolium]
MVVYFVDRLGIWEDDEKRPHKERERERERESFAKGEEVSTVIKEREYVVEELERLSGNHMAEETTRLLRHRKKRDLDKMTRLKIMVNESHLSVREKHTFVINLERLVSNLCTIWIERYHLHANYVRFERPQKPKSSIPRGPNHSTPKETNMVNSKKSFVYVLRHGSQSYVTPEITKPALVLDETCIKEFDFGMSLMRREKDVSAIPNLPCIISKEGFQNVKLSYLGGMIVWISIEGLPIKAWTPHTFRKIASLWGEYVKWEDVDLKSLSSDITNKADNNESDVDRVSKSSFMHENDTAHKDVNSCKKGEVGSHSEDPFNIYEENIKDNTERVQSLSNKLNDRCLNRGFSSQRSMNSHSQKSKVGGSILDLMDEFVTIGQTMGYNMTGLRNKAKRRWIKELCQKHRINFASIQETKIESISLHTIKDLWGNQMFDHVVGSYVGCSGGILCMWNPNMFVKEQVSTCDYFVALMGTWAPTSSKLLIISVYAPQELNERRDLWDYLRTFIDRWEGNTVIMGDFNEVHSKHERFGSTFKRQGAIAFNNFISSACLIDLPLEGYAFTWAHKSASKMSKLDRYLISKGVLDLFPHLSALCLDQHLSDHRPILLRETNYDYGPSPFRFFHSWFVMEGFNSFVETT